MNRIRMANIMVGFLLLSATAMQGCVTVPGDNSPRQVNVDEAVEARVAAGLEYIRRGEAGPARHHLSRALELDDDNARAHNAMALLYRFEKDQENEERHYKKALKADSDYATARNNYGILLFKQGRMDEARKQFLRAANNSSYESRGVAWGNLGRVYAAEDKIDKAREAFVKAVRLNPEESSAHLELATIYYQQDNPRLAWQYYQQYAGRVRTQSPQGLWLGIRLANHFEKLDQQSSYELALKRLYPGSKEYEEWRAWRDRQLDDGGGKAGANG